MWVENEMEQLINSKLGQYMRVWLQKYEKLDNWAFMSYKQGSGVVVGLFRLRLRLRLRASDRLRLRLRVRYEI